MLGGPGCIVLEEEGKGGGGGGGRGGREKEKEMEMEMEMEMVEKKRRGGQGREEGEEDLMLATTPSVSSIISPASIPGLFHTLESPWSLTVLFIIICSCFAPCLECHLQIPGFSSSISPVSGTVHGRKIVLDSHPLINNNYSVIYHCY
jgi:hypothetical protein